MDVRAETVGEAIDEIPVGRFHWRLMAVLGGMWAAMGVSVLSISFVLPTFVDTWGLSELEAGVLGSASLVGMLVGNSLGGWYADHAGRRRTMAITVLVFSVFSALTALSVGLYSAIVFRFLTGLGLGGALVAGVSYTTEHLPTSHRGRYVTYLEAFFTVGSFVAVLTAWATLSALPADGDLLGVDAWRVFFALGIVPLGLGVVVHRYLPESPYYLATNGRKEAAAARIESIARTNDVTPPTVTESGTKDGADEGSIQWLFRDQLAGTTVLVAGLWVAVNLAYYGIFTWLPSTVVAAGYVGSLYRYLTLVAIFQLLGQLSGAYLIDTIGRKWTLGALLTLGGVSTSLFASALPGVALDLGLPDTVTFTVGICTMGFALFGAWAVLYAYTSEVFPTEVRSTGLGLSGSVGKVAAAAGPILFGSLVSVGYLAALLPVAVVLVLAGVALLVFGRETSGESLV